ncbi:MAG: glycosyltransferase family 4 protein [Planctomycetaceae bacterium]|nr:glycosyltransferase family 4 protein [Planctomycetaceae bacterium]
MPHNVPRVLVPVTFPGGGIRTYMIYNLKPLHKSGFRFTFISAKGNTFDNFKNDFADCEGTEFVEFSSGTLNAVKAIRNELKSELKSGRYSLVHSQGLQAGTLTEIAGFLGRAKKPPSIITLHDVILPQNDIPGKFKWLKKRIISFFTRRASVIIPVSHDCAENHMALFPSWKKGAVKVKVITNGIAISGRQTEHSAVNEPLTGGFFGRFMPQKGFDILLDALLLLNEKGYGNRLKLLATIDRHGYTNETLERVESSPVLKQMVQFVEQVPELTPLLQQIDVLVMPSRWEAFGLLAAEAMVQGVSVIGSSCLGLREVLRDTPSMMFPFDTPEQVQSLTECLIEFIENAAKYKTAAQDYVMAASERFDVSKSAEELLNVYSDLICR